MAKVRLALAPSCCWAAAENGKLEAGTAPYDLVLKNGWIVDGSGNPRYQGDVAIRGDRIAAVGFLNRATARETLEVRGLVWLPASST